MGGPGEDGKGVVLSALHDRARVLRGFCPAPSAAGQCGSQPQMSTMTRSRLLYSRSSPALGASTTCPSREMYLHRVQRACRG